MTVVEDVGIDAQNVNIMVTRMRRKANDKRFIHELRGTLPPIVYNYIRGYKITQRDIEYFQG